jgi:hypothetical protein
MMRAKLPGLLVLCIALGIGSWPTPAQAQTPAAALPPPSGGGKPEQVVDNTSSSPAISSQNDLPPEPEPKLQLLLPLPGDESPNSFGVDGPMGGRSPFGNPLVGQASIRGDYRATWFDSEPVAGQATNLGYFRQELTVSSPVWQKSGQDEWSVFASVRDEIFQTHAILPDTRQAFPEDLWNIRFGTSYRYLFDNGWVLGGTLSVGSASDKPFNGFEEMTAGVNAFLRIPSGENNAWLFSLTYSPTGQLPYPIPTVAYVWQPSETFRMNIGLPFMLMWRPTEEVTLDVTYMLLTTLHARVSYRLSDQARLYVAYASESEAYLLADRVDNDDRFYNVDQRAYAGSQYFFTKKCSLDLSGGYLFDRYFFEGKNISTGSNFNRVDLGAGPYASAQFQLRW